MKDRHERLSQLFLAACEMTQAEQAAFLERECEGDAELQVEVLALLTQDARQTAPMAQISPADWIGGAVQLPEQIGSYRITRCLGQGGMGTVYEAQQENPARKVAVKVVRAGFASAQNLRRFEYEAQALGRLEHPGIARIFEAGTADLPSGKQPFFAMEYVEGLTLGQWCRQQESSTEERLELLLRICDALEHAHGKGVIHRDLKPANILVDASGQPKLLDFGVARLTDGDTQASSALTDAGQMVGTLAYMSPEQVQGDPGALDVRSDVYALGVLGYELLAQCLPYDLLTRSIPEAARIIHDQDATPLSGVSRLFRGDLSTIFAKVLEKDPARRYGSCAALAGDLRRYLNDEPIVARPSTTWYQMRKFARRNRWFVRGALATFLALLAGLASTLVFALRTQDTLALARLETGKARAVQDLFLETLAWADPYRTEGDTLTVVQALEAASTKLREGFTEDLELRAAFHTSLAGLYGELRRDQEAAEHYALALKALEEALGSRAPQTLQARGRVAGSLAYGGQYQEAAVLRAEIVAELQALGRPNDPEPFAEMARRCQDLRMAGHFAEAIEVGQVALKGLDELLKPAHPDRITALLFLSYACLQGGQHERAAETAQEAFELSRATQGEGDRLSLRCAAQLASVLDETGAIESAEQLQRETLDAIEERVGADHPNTLMAKMNLAINITRQGRANAGIEMFEEVVQGYQRVLGPSKRETLFAVQNLISAYMDNGRYEQGLALAEDLAVRARGAHDEGDSRLVWFALNRGMLLGYLERYEEALEVLDPAVERLEQIYGEEHRLTQEGLDAIERCWAALEGS